MANFLGQLNVNEIFTAIYNMIIGQMVYTDNISSTFSNFVDEARTEGSMFGDTYLYYATDALKTFQFDPDTADQCNVLSLDRPKDPSVQAITMSVFRQVRVTIDNYFTKRAFSTEGVFADFNGTMLTWLQDTKRIYDSTTYNVFLGTDTTTVGAQNQEIDLTDITPPATTIDEEGRNRLQAQTIAQAIANVLIQLRDPLTGKSYNDYGYYRSYSIDDIIIVWSSEWVNKIKKLDLPSIFHSESVMDKFDESNILPSHYFGTINTTEGTAPANNATVRSITEADYKVSTVTSHVFAGELVPSGATYGANETYTVNPDIVCKIIHKKSVPYMSGFEVATEFINAKNLSENHYLTFGRNELEHLKNYPMITVTAITVPEITEPEITE